MGGLDYSQRGAHFFCSHCDYDGDRISCPDIDRILPVKNGWCGRSRIDGVLVFPATDYALCIGGVLYRRENLLGIVEAVEKSKAGDFEILYDLTISKTL